MEKPTPDSDSVKSPTVIQTTYTYAPEIVNINIQEHDLKSIIDEIIKNKRPSMKYIGIPVGTLLTLLLTFITGEYKDWLTISKEVWEAICTIIFFGSIIAIIVMFICYCFKKHSYNEITSDDIVKKIREKSTVTSRSLTDTTTSPR